MPQPLPAHARSLWLDPASVLTNLDIELALGVPWRRLWARYGKRPVEASKARRLVGLRAVHGTPPQRIKLVERAIRMGELTMLEIAAEFGISKTTIYAHIPGGRCALRKNRKVDTR
jgi:hypothetical protein